jgi:two-component system phosphate regulon sensor histidine kinase PhoR
VETQSSNYTNINDLEALRQELNEIKLQLEEATDTINAIRSGEIDALIVRSDDGPQLYTLKGADHAYRIFIEQMTEGAVTLNTEGYIEYSNSHFAELVGKPLEKIIGKPFSSFFHPDCIPECLDLITQGWSADVKCELHLADYNKKSKPVLLSLKKLSLNEGPSLSVIVTDLTSQKDIQELLKRKNAELENAQKAARRLNMNLEKAVRERTHELEQSIQEKTRVENELRSNQSRLTYILETMAEGVVIIDKKGKQTYANPMAQKILGLRQTETNEPSKRYQNLKLDGSPLPDKEHPLFVTMSTGAPVFDYEIAIQPNEGDLFYISVNAAPIRDEKGNITGGIGTFMDVTNRRKSIQQKDDFISIASHELKTPITTLKASLQLLHRMQDSASAIIPKVVSQANKSMNKISTLIEDLLNATKITEGHLQLHRTAFKVADLFNNCCSHVRIEGKYELVVVGDKDIEVFADEHQIDQVVVNLVNNAIKYAPESKQIILSVEKYGDKAKLSVTDRGPGISEEKIPHLFNRYYRVDNKSVQFSGLGLGLYICSEIIKKHQGEIGVQSEAGKGSTFWFTLPLATQENKQDLQRS